MVVVGVVVVEDLSAGTMAKASPSCDPGDGVAVGEGSAAWHFRGVAEPKGALLQVLEHRWLVENRGVLSCLFPIFLIQKK